MPLPLDRCVGPPRSLSWSVLRAVLTRLAPGDDSDRVQFAFLFVWLLVGAGAIGLAALVAALVQHWISFGGFVLGLLLLPVAVYGLARLVWALIAGTSRGLVNTIVAGGNLTPQSSFSLEEAMLLRGEPEAARRSLEARLADHPDDLAIRFKLASVLRDHLGDAAGAERLYLEGRGRPSGAAAVDAIANALIDLYERTGNRGRLMVEYARFAQRPQGTAAGGAARRGLAELKGAEEPADGRAG